MRPIALAIFLSVFAAFCADAAMHAVNLRAAAAPPQAPAAPDPQTAFENPPLRAKTGVWWHWMGSNVTKDGLAARPSKGRKCFADWNYFDKDSRLVPSGLLGPVKLVARKVSE